MRQRTRIIDRAPDERQGVRPGAGVYNRKMPWARARPLVAFDAASLSGGSLTRSFGRRHLASAARLELPPGSLVPSALDENLADPEAVRAALGRLLDRIGGSRSGATLVLPDAVGRGLIFEAAGGIAPVDQARFRLAPGLPYPAQEALVDVRALGERRFLGIAIRRRVVQGYEALAESAGLSVERVDIASMAALEGLMRLPSPADSTVDVILGDTAISLAAHLGGSLRVFRSRLRASGAGEADRLASEVLRTATLAGDGAAPRVRIVGPGAAELARALSARGTRAEPGWRADGAGLPVDAAEIPWLGVALP